MKNTVYYVFFAFLAIGCLSFNGFSQSGLTNGKKPKLVFPNPETGAITCAAFSPDDKLLLTGNEHGQIKLWEVESGREIGIIDEEGQFRADINEDRLRQNFAEFTDLQKSILAIYKDNPDILLGDAAGRTDLPLAAALLRRFSLFARESGLRSHKWLLCEGNFRTPGAEAL